MFQKKSITYRLCLYFFGLLAFTGSSSVLADAQAQNKGETLYKQQCIACHGVNAEGNQALKAPKLAGQFDWYLKNQMNSFKLGHRGKSQGDTAGASMAAISNTLNDTQITQVATYLSLLKTKPSQSTVKGDLIKGEQFYQSLCGSCHGPNGKGNQALNSPKLSGLNDWYLVEQVQKYRSGKRGYHADDRLGRQMKMMSTILPDQDAINDVAHYLSTQQ